MQHENVVAETLAMDTTVIIMAQKVVEEWNMEWWYMVEELCKTPLWITKISFISSSTWNNILPCIWLQLLSPVPSQIPESPYNDAVFCVTTVFKFTNECSMLHFWKQNFQKLHSFSMIIQRHENENNIITSHHQIKALTEVTITCAMSYKGSNIFYHNLKTRMSCHPLVRSCGNNGGRLFMNKGDECFQKLAAWSF